MSVECVIGKDPTVGYLLQALVPGILAVAMFIIFGVSQIVAKVCKCCKAWEFDKTINSLGQLYTMVFIVLCTIVALPGMCYNHPNGKASVVRYPSVLCGTNDHSPLVFIAVGEFLLFVAPYVALCIFGNNQIIKIQSSGEAPTGFARIISGANKSGITTRFRFLMYRFRPDRWWWGNVFLLRQTVLAFAPLVPANDPHSQSIVVCAVLIIYGVAVAKFWPWKAHVLNVIDTLHCVCLSIFVCAGTAFMQPSPETGLHAGVMIVCFTIVVVSVTIVFATALNTIMKHGRSRDFQMGFFSAGPPEGLHKSLKQLARMCQALSEQDTGLLLKMMNQYDWITLKEAVGIWYAVCPEAFESSKDMDGAVSRRVMGLAHSTSVVQTSDEAVALKALVSAANGEAPLPTSGGGATAELHASDAELRHLKDQIASLTSIVNSSLKAQTEARDAPEQKAPSDDKAGSLRDAADVFQTPSPRNIDPPTAEGIKYKTRQFHEL